MAKDGTYADHIVIHSLSKVLGCTIKIVHAEGPDVDVGERDHGYCLVVGYIPDINHYISLEPIRITPEDFVAVRCRSIRSNTCMYVAKVLQVGEELKVRYMQPTVASELFTWYDNQETYDLPHRDVIGKLSSPKLVPGRGIKLQLVIQEMEDYSKQL